MNLRQYQRFQVTEFLYAIDGYDELNAITSYSYRFLGVNVHSLTFFVSSPGQDLVNPAILSIDCKTKGEALALIHRVRMKIRFDLAEPCQLELKN